MKKNLVMTAKLIVIAAWKEGGRVGVWLHTGATRARAAPVCMSVCCVYICMLVCLSTNFSKKSDRDDSFDEIGITYTST